MCKLHIQHILVLGRSKMLDNQNFPEAAGVGGGTFQGGRISKKITKIACLRSFKCFTALNIRPSEVFCDV